MTTIIKPRHVFSFRYNLYDDQTSKLAAIEVSFWAKLLKSNSANILVGEKKYRLVDAITVVGGHIGSGQRSTNTYIELDGNKLFELIYEKQGTNQNFVVKDIQTNQKLDVKLKGFGTFKIYEGEVEIGTLYNKDLLFRKSTLEMKRAIPLLLQVIIFWGSQNTHNIV